MVAPRTPLPLLALLAVAVLWMLTGPAHAFSVDSWSVTWTQQIDSTGHPVTLADDFEDGVFPGFPEYGVLCGSVSPGDESGGRLRIGDDPETGPGCNGIELLSRPLLAAGEMIVRATYDFAVPAPNQFYGITAGNDDGTDFVSLVVTRGDVPLAGDRVLIGLSDESFDGTNLVGVFVLGQDPEDLVGDFASVELELTLSPLGADLVAGARFRFDQNTFQALGANPLGGSDGVLDLFELHGASLVATPEPGTLILLASGLAGLGVASRRGPG